MRQQSVSYFLGSILSRQALFAYGIAAGITTALQVGLVWMNVFSRVPLRTDALPLVIGLYIETLIPIWIPPITAWNVFILLSNCLIAIWILLSWTMSYDRATGF